ncbi:hypothetical protein APS67_003320 [Streptomyces sp. AVP053U2]|nr:hypothetical protein APS67_003320 [Streptomyces sp. AVP053U2]
MEPHGADALTGLHGTWEDERSRDQRWVRKLGPKRWKAPSCFHCAAASGLASSGFRQSAPMVSRGVVQRITFRWEALPPMAGAPVSEGREIQDRLHQTAGRGRDRSAPQSRLLLREPPFAHVGVGQREPDGPSESRSVAGVLEVAELMDQDEVHQGDR